MKQTFLFTFLLCLITLSCETDSYTEYTVSADAPNTKSTISSDDAVAQVKEFLSGWNVNTAYSGDSRSPIPMISVHSVGDLLYRRQS